MNHLMLRVNSIGVPFRELLIWVDEGMKKLIDEQVK